MKKVASDALRAVKRFLRKGEVAGFNLGEMINPKPKKKVRARTTTKKRTLSKLPTVAVEAADGDTGGNTDESSPEVVPRKKTP